MNEILLSQDWANLNRFKNENDSVNINRDEDRIVFMGNSITQGWIEQRPEFFAGKPYINRGISGQTTPQMLLRFRQDVINLKPKVVVILAGTNDIAGNTGPSTLEMILDNLLNPNSQIGKYIDVERLQINLNDHFSGRKDFSWEIWRLLSLEKFLNLFINNNFVNLQIN